MTEQQEAVQQVRPLPQAQSRNLVKIVETDYAVLRSDLYEFAREQIAQKRREIEASASPTQMREVEDRAHKILTEYEEAVRSLKRTAEDWGMSVSMPEVHRRHIGVTNTRMREQIEEAKREVESERDTALAALDRAEQQAKRAIYQASVTAAGEGVLSSLPTAEEAMLSAAQERATRALG